MAIGRISGPMLVPNLERQNINLSVDGDLIYFDVIQRRVGINTDAPNFDLDVVGTANITGNVFVGNTVTIGNLYQLPTYAPQAGQVITAEGFGSIVTYWGPGSPEGSIQRRYYETTIDSLLGYGNVDVVLPLGISSIVYALSVSRPVKVEVFGTPDKSEPNPYTFIATPDHLTDDGVVILNDGSSYQSRQYSIFANMEDPPSSNVYVTVSSLDPFEASTPVKLSVLYFPAVTDSRPGMEVVDELPNSKLYEGKMVFNKTQQRLYIFANGQWNLI